MDRHYLLVSDFDQTLSFHDSGRALCEMLRIDGFEDKVAGLARLNLVQQGAELAYLLRHDPEFRRVRKEDLIEVGKHVRLKRNVDLLSRLLTDGIPGHRFDFYVVSAAPEELIHSALEGLIPPAHVIGSRFGYHPVSGEIDSISRVTAGHGKVVVVEELRLRLGIPRDRVVYVGDGSSDLHVMLHVNRGDGFTIAVSESRSITEVAQRTVLSDDALSVLIPVLDEIVGYAPNQIRALFEANDVVIREWERVRTDWLTIEPNPVEAAAPVVEIVAA
ncbi:MAG TPA: haloacid dehalogenase-like hydrolase [Longimicrobiaceae bacterium]|nr:haloacid dehalogenase-like hydrolase [Longimicrobiaceae bacterium]